MKRISILVELEGGEDDAAEQFVSDLRAAIVSNPTITGSNVFVEIDDVPVPDVRCRRD